MHERSVKRSSHLLLFHCCLKSTLIRLFKQVSVPLSYIPACIRDFIVTSLFFFFFPCA